MDRKKWIALAGIVVGAAATAIASSAWGANANVHTACDVVLRVLTAIGFTAPVSLMGGSSGASAPVLKLTRPNEENKS